MHSYDWEDGEVKIMFDDRRIVLCLSSEGWNLRELEKAAARTVNFLNGGPGAIEDTLIAKDF